MRTQQSKTVLGGVGAAAAVNQDLNLNLENVPNNFNLYDYILGEEVHLVSADFESDDVVLPILKSLPMEKEKVKHKCKICKKDNFQSVESLRGHLVSEHHVRMNMLGFRNDTGTGVFPNETCKHCSKSFNSRREYLAHIASTTPIPCLFCAKKFACGSLWSAHFLKKHFSTACATLKCIQCDSVLSSKHNLLNHYATHLDVKYGCRFCKSQFRTIKGLRNHLKMHPDALIDEYVKRENRKRAAGATEGAIIPVPVNA